jgi:hypothetical protein
LGQRRSLTGTERYSLGRLTASGGFEPDLSAGVSHGQNQFRMAKLLKTKDWPQMGFFLKIPLKMLHSSP